MDDKIFTWTSDRTMKMFDLRFENDWLFRKKKQPWKEFRNILLQNGFPKEMTLSHVRKKWSYTYDCYKIAKRTKNKKWLYYKVFDKHFRKNKALDRYDSWNDEWRIKLISSITVHKDLSDHNNMWRAVEVDLRSEDLPMDCCIQDIKGLWHHLKITFNRKYRLKLKKGAELTLWEPYDAMYNYYKTFDPSFLLKLEEEGCVVPRVRFSSKNYNKKVKEEPDSEAHEFHWTRDITESFIQLRLQHEWLFRERKWAWNDLAAILWKEYSFPRHLNGRMLCHKWSSTYADYQKAKAMSNTNWVYYNLFEMYLGHSTLSYDPIHNWNEEWVHNLIRIRTELEEYFEEVEKPYTAWREVEKTLRSERLPVDHTLLQLPEMWMQLVKTFKWKKKFAERGVLNEKWPYFEAMSNYTTVRAKYQSRRAAERSSNGYGDTANYIDDMDGQADDYEDDIKLFDLKKKLQSKPQFEVIESNCCRSCGSEGGCVDLFQPFDDDDVDLATKLKIIGGIEVGKTDNFPNQICVICVRELENAYNFRMKCQTIDNHLRSIKQDLVKVEIQPTFPIDNNAPHDLPVELNNEKVEVEVYDNDDHIADADDLYKEEDENKEALTKAIKRKLIKRRGVKQRKKYTYDYRRVCEVCGKHTRNIKSHMDSHSTEKVYSCEECGKKFKFKSGLTIHRAVHDPTPKKTCEVCGKKFHIMAQYRKHFVYHANERKFTCETCGKAFHTKDILTVHMRMHTDERPFSCPECGKTFRTAGCVSRHRRIVHKKTVKT